MLIGKKDRLSKTYSAWFGKAVVLLIRVRRYHIPMPCRIMGESSADVHIRIQPGWDLDVKKELILSVEEFAVFSAVQVN